MSCHRQRFGVTQGYFPVDCLPTTARSNLIKHSGENVEIDFFKQEHIVIQRRYEALGALNDFLIAIWFLVGSVMFLSNSLRETGTWLFILGSTQFLVKPAIKLISLIHVKRIYDACSDKARKAGNADRFRMGGRSEI